MMAEGIKFPVHISVPLDDHKIDWLTVKCDNEEQLKQALIDSKANSDLFRQLGIGDTAVNYAELVKARGEYKSPPTNPVDTAEYSMEEYGKTDGLNDVCEHGNHQLSSCDDCFDIQVYEQLAIDEKHRLKMIALRPLSLVEWIKCKLNNLKTAMNNRRDRLAEEQGWSEHMRS